MTRTVVYLAFFFFVTSLVQLGYLHWTIGRGVEPPDAVSRIYEVASEDAAARLAVLARLEGEIIHRRYRQASVALISRLWINYLGFVTGMILALVGAVFILGKLETPASRIEGRVEAASVAIRSSSPGIILAALGVVLIITTIVTNHRIEMTDRAIFVGEGLTSASTVGSTTAPPPLRAPKGGNASGQDQHSDTGVEP
jgi:hypothetical protein